MFGQRPFCSSGFCLELDRQKEGLKKEVALVEEHDHCASESSFLLCSRGGGWLSTSETPDAMESTPRDKPQVENRVLKSTGMLAAC